MSSNTPNLTKQCSFEQYQTEVNNCLYALWFGVKPHTQFEDLKHPIMFITDINEDRAFGFVVTRINHFKKTISLRAQHISNANLHEFLKTESITIISGDIAPTLIKLSD